MHSNEKALEACEQEGATLPLPRSPTEFNDFYNVMESLLEERITRPADFHAPNSEYMESVIS